MNRRLPGRRSGGLILAIAVPVSMPLLAVLSGPALATGFSDMSLTPLTIPALRSDVAAGTVGLVQEAHAETLRPAPLPDPDVTPPGPSSDTLASESDPSLGPGIFNPQSHFAGDGYEPGSSIDNDKNHRHTTGGGMNLSIPMQ